MTGRPSELLFCCDALRTSLGLGVALGSGVGFGFGFGFGLGLVRRAQYLAAHRHPRGALERLVRFGGRVRVRVRVQVGVRVWGALIEKTSPVERFDASHTSEM